MLCQLFLVIAQHKSPAAHNIQNTKRNPCPNGFQGNIQVDFGLMKNKRHIPVIIRISLIIYFLQSVVFVCGIQIHCKMSGQQRKGQIPLPSGCLTGEQIFQFAFSHLKAAVVNFAIRFVHVFQQLFCHKLGDQIAAG